MNFLFKLKSDQPWRGLPQSSFLLSTLLLQFQDPLFQPVNNLEHILKTCKVNSNLKRKKIYAP